MARARYLDNREFYLALGARVAKARQDRLTQEQLGKKVGLTRTSIINIEKGRQQVLVHTLAEIARALDTSLANLMPKQDDLETALRDASRKGREWILSSAGTQPEEK